MPDENTTSTGAGQDGKGFVAQEGPMAGGGRGVYFDKRFTV